MHDFAPQQPNVTCLSFRAGQVIHVLNRDSSGWWDGELDGRRGWFPSNYVTSEVGLLTEEELPSGKVSFIVSALHSFFFFLPTFFSYLLVPVISTRGSCAASTVWHVGLGKGS